MEAEFNSSLEYTPTWIVAIVCSVIVLISLCAERGLHRLGKLLERKGQDKLYEALTKLKEELMLLGFISLLLTAFQGFISRICIPTHLSSTMLPCKRGAVSSNGSEHYSNLATNNRRQLLSEDTNSGHCHEGKVPLLSLEALHQLHIFIFVLALVHVIFCVSTMFLGGVRIRQWKVWEDSIRQEISEGDPTKRKTLAREHNEFFKQRTQGYWRKAAVVSWMISFFKQFHGSVTKSDYTALRLGFIKEHCQQNQEFDFHKYMVRTLEVDFKKVVGISWYLWLFVVVFLLLNVAGWHSYFWLSFLPVILLLLVGAKLEHIITRLAHEAQAQQEQNSFEIAFFFWILCTYGFNSCIMEKPGFIITRLVMGVIVQVLCSYCTMPLYALVTQMGSAFKRGMFEEHVARTIAEWAGISHWAKERPKVGTRDHTVESQIQMQKMAKESPQNGQISEQAIVVIEETSTSITELR
ncbi:hypothetical protein RGQ29_013555 [Quercus rubra]|uniref:MLO-like protein n=1 Tax=Quercus rubra TaxID=3512 RepID=A0AAN7J577_QUERU|nr:hypothetical protein RGQ29_013555 [Quercus rubra]KAK4605544.1 hypothetical protein RGQ29_013555 [Quercus rubra]